MKLLLKKRKKQTVSLQVIETHDISHLGFYSVCNVTKGKGNKNTQIELLADSLLQKMKRYILRIDDGMIAACNNEY